MAEDTSDRKIFFDTIRSKSECKEYPDFLLEWKVIFRFERDAMDGYCICGHKIKEEITIRNKLNGNRLIVGNVCINQLAKEIVCEKCIYCGEKVRKAKNSTKTLCKDCKACKVIRGGKYNGKTLNWLIKNHPDYLKWIVSKGREGLEGWGYAQRVFDWLDRRKKNLWLDSDIEPEDEEEKKIVLPLFGL